MDLRQSEYRYGYIDSERTANDVSELETEWDDVVRSDAIASFPISGELDGTVGTCIAGLSGVIGFLDEVADGPVLVFGFGCFPPPIVVNMMIKEIGG